MNIFKYRELFLFVVMLMEYSGGYISNSLMFFDDEDELNNV